MKNLIFHTAVLVSGVILIYFGQIVCCNYNIYLRKYIMTVLSENWKSLFALAFFYKDDIGGRIVHSQHNDWQIAQSRDYFCDYGRKLVNLSLPVNA